ncbi:MAG: methylated-DNA--[protein]-cysteine S-methyltransferase [candidate division WOR-3 bacterium]
MSVELGQKGWTDQAQGRYARMVLKQLKEYFDRQRTDFDLRLDLKRFTNFERKVLIAVRKIPYGQTISYSAIARSISVPEGARAVGQVVAKNPWPIIIPCHRVIRADGLLGGFGGGIKWKRRLLRLEGILK